MKSCNRNCVILPIVVIGVALMWAVCQFTQEHFNVVALLVAALCFYYLGARFYSAFLADRVLKLDDANITPAHRLRDDHDHLPYRRWTLFGMHFAWIAGPGPLIGPTLAAQFGYLPGFLWIVLGAVLMGCVQDMVILAFSTRRDGMSLARMIKSEVNPLAGLVASAAVLLILEILIGVLALIVVNALKGSPWATFTILCSIPIAFFVGWYMTKLCPGREGQGTAIGVALLLVATAGGHFIAVNPAFAAFFTRTPKELMVGMIVYGLMAAALPAWMLLAPRDNISTYLKIGTVALLAVGIVVAHPSVQMPAVTRFVDGSGPIVSGGIFPFCFIIIACGAISGFHSLISSGVTPRFVDKETDIRVIGYGAMLTESFVGVMALIAAVTLVPGVYLAMNAPGAPGVLIPSAAQALALTQKISAFGPQYHVAPADMTALAHAMGEKTLYSRAGGGPSLAVGMANIFGGALPASWIPFWYHFAIMFEAVFILTVVDSGTRVIRFVIHEMAHDWSHMRGAPARETAIPLWLTSGLAVVGWGGILYWGIADANGGTKALLKMFGVSNQMLAVIALALATVVMLKRHRAHAWITGLPMIAMAVTTLTAAYEMIFSPDPRVGAIASAHAAKTAQDIANAWLQTGLVAGLSLCVIAVLWICGVEIARLSRLTDGEPAAPNELAAGEGAR